MYDSYVICDMLRERCRRLTKELSMGREGGCGGIMYDM